MYIANYKDFQNIAVYDKYLIIKDKYIQIFLIDIEKGMAKLEAELLLQDELKDIIIIDVNNIFFNFHGKYIKFDIATKKYSNVKFSRFEEKLPISHVTSVHFNENIKFLLNDKTYYFGFIATESGDIFLSKEVIEHKDTNTHNINCDFIKSFGEDIQNIQFKKFVISDVEYFIIYVLTKTVGYYFLLSNIKDLNQYDLFYEELLKANWSLLYQYNNEIISKIYYSSQYDANDGTPVSIIILTDTLKLKVCKFNRMQLNIEVIDLDIKQEIINSSFIDKSFKISDVVAVHHYYNVIFLSFKKRIYLYHITLCKIIAAWNFEAETIMDLYIYDKLNSEKRQSNLYYIFFLTNRSILYTKIETNYKASLFKDNSHNIFVENDSLQDKFILKVILT
jgi:hypothetical protein